MAAKTHYSKASWGRWLNGKRLITPQALKSLVACVDCDVPALLALHEAAARETRQPSDASAGEQAPDAVEERAAAPERSEAPPPDDELMPPDDAADRSTARRVPRMLLLAVAAAVVVFVSGVVWLTGGGGAWGPSGSPAERTAGTRPTAAPPPCQGIGCAGKDPQSTGCVTDAEPPVTANDGKVILYIHYSPRCRAAWSGITNGAKGDTATISNGTGGQETALIHWGYDNYSMMVDAGDPKTVLQVCGEQPAGRACTASVANPADHHWPGH